MVFIRLRLERRKRPIGGDLCHSEPVGRGPFARLGRGQAAMGRVRPGGVVVVAPARDHGARLGQRREDLLIQALIPEAGVEALDESVLLRLAGGDVMPLDAGSVRPVEDRPRGELGPVASGARTGGASAGDR